MTRRLVWSLLALQLLGTQVPSAWLGSVERSLHAPFFFSSLAHFVLFASVGGLLVAQSLAWPVRRVVLSALGLALSTEGLQFWALNRHPHWGNVDIDMAGVLAGVRLTNLVSLCFARR